MPKTVPNSPHTAQSTQWFEAWFNHPLYMEVYRHRDHNEATQCIRTILQHTALEQATPATTTVLDIACGAGRHAIELARRGYNVTGNDLSTTLLNEAAKAAKQEKLPLQLTNYDMRHVPTHQRYQLVVQLFTSFGYFDSKAEDGAVVQKVWELLHKNGWYVLDLLNPDYLAANFIAESQRQVGELTIKEKRTLEANRVRKELCILSPSGETLHFSEAVWLYSADEIVDILHNVGFHTTEIVGNYDGSTFNATSPRMMLFCHKA
uniref:Methyltransferase, putative n=1 Tax=Chlorobium chlorochromatii (strain CaD3) TaxID=340177 RepID=Q3AS64_CHLCH